MSLEDKAKEYVDEQSWNDVPDCQVGVFTIGDIRNFERGAFESGYKQAIKDLIERAKALEQYPDNGLNGQAVYIEDLEKIAEDLIK